MVAREHAFCSNPVEFLWGREAIQGFNDQTVCCKKKHPEKPPGVPILSKGILIGFAKAAKDGNSEADDSIIDNSGEDEGSEASTASKR